MVMKVISETLASKNTSDSNVLLKHMIKNAMNEYPYLQKLEKRRPGEKKGFAHAQNVPSETNVSMVTLLCRRARKAAA